MSSRERVESGIAGTARIERSVITSAVATRQFSMSYCGRRAVLTILQLRQVLWRVRVCEGQHFLGQSASYRERDDRNEVNERMSLMNDAMDSGTMS
jgi:hypothetical protein